MSDKRIVCKSCLQPIDRVFEAPYAEAPKSEWEMKGWIHPRRPDTKHEPEPLNADEAPFIDQVCDFCGAPDVTWIFPTDINQPREFHGLKLAEEAWAACELCHDDILASPSGRDLARRIEPRSLPLRDVPERLHRHLVDVVLAGQYQQFMTARSGKPIMLAEYNS